MKILLAALVVALTCGGCAQTSRQAAETSLGGTSWQLVKFQGSDDTVLIPDDRTKYTITFETDGALIARIDCNRGRGTWKSSGPNQLEFGTMAVTGAMCLAPSLHDQIVKHWEFIRSYVIKDGHLFLSLMADGGIYEFEPMADATSANTESEKGWQSFHCPNEQTVLAQFHLPEDQFIDILFAGRELRLPRVISASGARYSDGKTTFWNKGTSALVQVGDTIVVQDCVLEK